MRILHTADLHLGLQTHSWPDPTTGIPSRILDVGRAWQAACQFAVANEIDAVIVAGDVFHGRDPDATSLNLFAQGLRLLEDEKIPTLVIAGNHDGAVGPNRQSVLEVFASERVAVVTRPQIVWLAGAKVAALPWVSRQELMAKHAELTRTDAVAATAEALQRILDAQRSALPEVLVGHWSIQGSVLGNERDIAIVGDGEVMIPQADLEGPWSYAAFGHIHGKQFGGVGSSTWAYSGSIDRMNFGEEREPKGVYVVDVGGESEFVELPARRFVTIDGPVGMARDVEDAIVRVRMRVSADEAAVIDRTQIERGLYEAGAALVYVHVDVEREARARAERLTSALGFNDAIAEWFRIRDVDGDEADELHRMIAELDRAGAVVEGAHAGVANAGDAGSSPAPRSEQVAS